jgi:hypothetical protein
MNAAKPLAQRDRAGAEAAVKIDGRERLRFNRTAQVLWRISPEMKEFLADIVDAYSEQKGEKVTWGDTIEAALKLLDEKLRAKQ